MFKKVLTAAAFAMVASQAQADTINFDQFGSDNTNLSSPLHGTTQDGVGFTIASPNGGFTVLTEGSSWFGIFKSGSPILFDGDGPGTITIDFDAPIQTLTLAGQSNAYGAYTETASAYSNGTLVDTASADSFNHVFDSYPDYTGTVPYLTLTGVDITQVIWGATNDGVGLALYGGSGAPADNPGTDVPEPLTLSLFGAGLAGIAARRRRKAA